MVRREAPVLSRRDALAVLGFVALLLGLSVVASLLPGPGSADGFRLRAYPTHVLWYVLVLSLVALLARDWDMPRRQLAALIVLVGTVAIAGNALDLFRYVDGVKVVFGALAGIAFVRALERPYWLLPICVLVPIADAWSVFSERGVTNEVVDRAADNPDWILWPTIATPIAGLPYAAFGRLGVVDVLFAGLFLGAAARWGWPAWRGIVAMTIALVVTSVLVFESLGVAVPALPLVCLAALIAYATHLLGDARAAWRERDSEDPTSSDSFTK